MCTLPSKETVSFRAPPTASVADLKAVVWRELTLRAARLVSGNKRAWWHGSLGRTAAEALLLRHRVRSGTFLVRESRRQPGQLVLSFINARRCKHVHIHQAKGSFTLATQLCDSLDSLIELHKTLPVPMSGPASDDPALLTQPCLVLERANNSVTTLDTDSLHTDMAYFDSYGEE